MLPIRTSFNPFPDLFEKGAGVTLNRQDRWLSTPSQGWHLGEIWSSGRLILLPRHILCCLRFLCSVPTTSIILATRRFLLKLLNTWTEADANMIYLELLISNGTDYFFISISITGKNKKQNILHQGREKGKWKLHNTTHQQDQCTFGVVVSLWPLCTAAHILNTYSWNPTADGIF